MKTNLVLLGSATAMLGALGLIFFGSSIVSIYKIVLLNFTAPPCSGSIHDVLSGLRIATVAGIALTLGLACACYGISKDVLIGHPSDGGVILTNPVRVSSRKQLSELSVFQNLDVYILKDVDTFSEGLTFRQYCFGKSPKAFPCVLNTFGVPR